MPPVETSPAAGRSPAGPTPEAPEPDLARLEAGLDALEHEDTRRASPRMRVRRAVVPPLVAVGSVLLVWQAVVLTGVQPRYVLPGPGDVFLALSRAWSTGDLPEALGTSLSRGLVGFAIAVVIGTPLGLLLAAVTGLRTAVGPLVSGLQVLPSVAWVPAAIIWFGLSDATVYAVVLLGAVPSIINGLLAGVDQVPPLHRQVGRVLGAGRVELVRSVVLPSAFPGFLAGLKQGWAFSWRSLMAAEIIAVGGDIGFGLGALLQQGRELADLALVMSAVLVILFVGIAVELLGFAPLERRVLRRRGLLVEQAR